MINVSFCFSSHLMFFFLNGNLPDESKNKEGEFPALVPPGTARGSCAQRKSWDDVSPLLCSVFPPDF